MAYTRNTWVDRVVQYARRYRDQNNNQITLTPDPGTVTAEGTTINAAKLNNIENWIEETDALIVDTAQANKLVKTNSSGDFPGNALSVDGIHFRNTTGILEYSTDGVVWNSVGGKIVKASDTLQMSWDTERIGGSTMHMKAAQLIPDFDGTIRISIDVKRTDSAQFLLFIAEPLITHDAGNGVAGLSANKMIDLPIGSSLSTSTKNYYQETFTTTTAYVTKYLDITVHAGLPVILYYHLETALSVKNIRMYWTAVTSAEKLG